VAAAVEVKIATTHHPQTKKQTKNNGSKKHTRRNNLKQ
jgi:hypothetical protein